MPINVGTALATGNSRQVVGNIITHYHGTPGETEEEREWNKIRDWLTPSGTTLQAQSHIHEHARSSRADGTGIWFHNSVLLREWLEGSATLMWVHGSAGCGKTVIFASTVENILGICRASRTQRCCFFYCTERVEISDVLGFLLVQLCRLGDVGSHLRNLYDNSNEVFPSRIPTIKELTSTLENILRELGPKEKSISDSVKRPKLTSQQAIYILIDGVDEIPFDRRRELCRLLSHLARLNMSHVRLFITSRSQPDIQEVMNSSASWRQVSIERGTVQPDINHFVSCQVESEERFHYLPVEAIEAIKTRVAGQANGMFLWAVLLLKYLPQLRVWTSDDVMEALNSLPEDLNETYSRILRQIDKPRIPMACRALMWLVYSKRSLYIEELVDACAIDLQQDSLLGKRLQPYNIFEMLHDLILIHPPILSRSDHIPPRTHTVTLFHASLREFLCNIDKHGSQIPPQIQQFYPKEEAAHKLIAKSCLEYLYQYNKPGSKRDEFPLIEYVFYGWERHVHWNSPETSYVQSNTDAIIRTAALDLFIRWKQMIENRIITTVDETRYLSDFLREKNGIRFLEAINTPYFHPNYDLFYLPTTASGMFKPLSTSRPMVRFLEMLPSLDTTSKLECRLFEADLDEHPRYVALSYAWGSHKSYHDQILVQGVTFQLVPSQARLLRALRSRVDGSPSAIWLDTLCINQRNYREKGYQISLMDRIYMQAHDVIIVFGEQIYTDRQGINALYKFAEISELLQGNSTTDGDNNIEKAFTAIQSLHSDGSIDAMAALFRDPWWSRIWVVQEAVLAANAIVLFDSLSFNFNAIVQAVEAEEVIRSSLQPKINDTLFELESNAGFLAAKRIMRTRSQWRESGGLPLSALLWRFRSHNCTIPRERIYSLLRLCREETPFLSSDYAQPDLFLFKKLSEFLIQTSRSLDILSVCSAYKQNIEDEDQMQWIPLLMEKRDRVPLILGVFEWPPPSAIYSASGDICPGHLELFSYYLEAKGEIFDTVQVVRPCIDCGIKMLCQEISRCQKEYCKETYPDIKSMINARWRTLLADQWPLGHRLRGDDTIMRGFKIPSSEAEEDFLAQEYTANEMPFLKGRSIIITSTGYLGLGPEETKNGDRVAVLAGGAVPYIVKPQCYSVSWIDKYSFVGECYIHGCMDGEALRQLPSFQKEPQNWARDLAIIQYRDYR